MSVILNALVAEGIGSGEGLEQEGQDSAAFNIPLTC